MSADTTKTINLAQLDEETGGAGLHSVEVDGTRTIRSLGSVSDSALESAIDDHVAGPEDTRTVEQKLAQSGLTIAELSAALGL